MRAVLIDPTTQTITEVTDYIDTLQGMYDALSSPDCKVEDINSVRVGQFIYLWVDGEGYLKEPTPPLFEWRGYGQPLAGKGLILGFDEETGNNLPYGGGLQWVIDHVKWSTKRFSHVETSNEEGLVMGQPGFIMKQTVKFHDE